MLEPTLAAYSALRRGIEAAEVYAAMLVANPVVTRAAAFGRSGELDFEPETPVTTTELGAKLARVNVGQVYPESDQRTGNNWGRGRLTRLELPNRGFVVTLVPEYHAKRGAWT